MIMNNAVLRSVRYMLSLSEGRVIEIIKLSGLKVTPSDMASWLKKDDEPEYREMSDEAMGHFLNGLIFFRRGKNEELPPPPLETRLTNNIVLKKLRVAFELKDTDMLDIFNLVDFRISKPEISAFFRKPGHKNYRECGEQVLRNFLKGLTQRVKGKDKATS